MRRLQPFQNVEVCMASSFGARALAVDRRQVALHPDQAVDIVWLPEDVPDTLLLFSWLGQRVMLKGTLHHRGDLAVVGFVVTDHSFYPAPATQVSCCSPIGLTPVDAAGHELGEQQWLQTETVGADGARIEPDCPVPAATAVRIELALPGAAEHLHATGEVVVGDRGGHEVRFTGIASDARVRLHRRTVQQQLLELRRRDAKEDVAYVW